MWQARQLPLEKIYIYIYITNAKTAACVPSILFFLNEDKADMRSIWLVMKLQKERGNARMHARQSRVMLNVRGLYFVLALSLNHHLVG